MEPILGGILGGDKPVDMQKEEKKRQAQAIAAANRRLGSAQGRSSTITTSFLGLPGGGGSDGA